MNFLKLCLCLFIGFCNSFKMSLINVTDRKTLSSVNACPQKVTIFTSNSCRACMKIKKQVDLWEIKFENIHMFRICINVSSMDIKTRKDIMRYCYNQNIITLPYLIVDNNGTISRFSCTPTNYDDIESKIKDLYEK